MKYSDLNQQEKSIFNQIDSVLVLNGFKIDKLSILNALIEKYMIVKDERGKH